VGRVGPDDLVEIDQVDSASSGEERIAVAEGPPGADEHASSERGVHLVAAPGDEICLTRKAAVRSELGGVDDDRHVAAMRGRDDRFERRQPTGDVRRTSDSKQARVR
jgi:hypothetical protein